MFKQKSALWHTYIAYLKVVVPVFWADEPLWADMLHDRYLQLSDAAVDKSRLKRSNYEGLCPIGKKQYFNCQKHSVISFWSYPVGQILLWSEKDWFKIK